MIVFGDGNLRKKNCSNNMYFITQWQLAARFQSVRKALFFRRDKLLSVIKARRLIYIFKVSNQHSLTAFEMKDNNDEEIEVEKVP